MSCLSLLTQTNFSLHSLLPFFYLVPMSLLRLSYSWLTVLSGDAIPALVQVVLWFYNFLRDIWGNLGEGEIYSVLRTAFLIWGPLCINMYRMVKSTDLGNRNIWIRFPALPSLQGNMWHQEFMVIELHAAAAAAAAAAIGYTQTTDVAQFRKIIRSTTSVWKGM